MSVKAKTASENQLILCAYYYYYSLQTLTIGFNHCNMIVHTWAKRYRGGCFSYSVSVDCHITVKCDFASSDKKYKNHGLFCFFVRTRHEWEFWRQNVTETWSIDDMSNSKDVIAGPEYTRLQKIVSFFFFPHSNHYYVNSKIYKSRLNHAGSLKIDKRDKLLKVNVLSDAEWLFGVTPKETCSKNNVTLHKKSDCGLQSSQKWNNSTSLDSSPV